MRFIIVCVFCVLCVGFANSQNPETPVIQIVSVDHASGKPLVRWKIQNPQTADGYIIKRYIRDFQNTYGYNTVAIIPGADTNEFVDTTTVYGEAKPELYSEMYRVAAYDSVDGERFLSPMSEMHATIFLQADFEYCKRANRLQWTNYEAWQNHFNSYTVFFSDESGNLQVIAETQYGDSLYLAPMLDFNETHRYYVQAENESGDRSKSNFLSVFSETPALPENIRITELSNEPEGTTRIRFESDDSEALSQFVLLSQTLSQTDTLQYIGLQNSTNYEIVAERELSAVPSSFRIVALDSCPFEIASSDSHTELILSAEQQDNYLGKNYLKLAEHPYLFEFELYRAFADENFKLTASFNSYRYEDDLTDDFLRQLQGELPQGFYSYKVESENNYTRYISNIVHCRHRPKLVIYNAIQPKSPYKEDNMFRPFAANLSNYRLQIFYPDGRLIFQSSDVQIGWDGRLPSGEFVPRGSYIYVIQYTDAQGKKCRERDVLSVVY